MLKNKIKVGESYLVGGHGIGRSVVQSEPELDPYSTRNYKVLIDHPDAPPDTIEARKKYKISTKEILREWTEDDQKKFESMLKIVENKRGWEEELSLLGFNGNIRVDDEGVISYVGFSGYFAERVIEALTGHTFPKEDEIAKSSS